MKEQTQYKHFFFFLNHETTQTTMKKNTKIFVFINLMFSLQKYFNTIIMCKVIIRAQINPLFQPKNEMVIPYIKGEINDNIL